MTTTPFSELHEVLLKLERRERRRRLIAFIGGQARLARRLKLDRSTLCRVVAGRNNTVVTAQVEGVIRLKLREISKELEQLWEAA